MSKLNLENFELDLKTHVIVSNNRMGFCYNLDLSHPGEFALILYFGIYPVAFYYVDEDIDTYRLRLKTICKDQRYLADELHKWYKEIYPKSNISNKYREYICRRISNWIDSLSTFDFELA